MNKKMDVMESIISLCKRRGFVYQGSEIYGGLAGTWDYGPYGVELKNNIKDIWWKRFVKDRADMFGVDAAILMNQNVWKASGHASSFADPLIECGKCKNRFRTDNIGAKISKDQWQLPNQCPECGEEGDLWKLAKDNMRQFNMMFQTRVGAVEDETAISYLRPETAQGMFVNFKNILDSRHPELPFGMAQIGKAFRNEIAPRDFLFRAREFEQMEIEYFVRPGEWEKIFEHFRDEMKAFMDDIGLNMSKVFELEVLDDERAHYSKRTVDFEFDFPFGRKELCGLAYRTDFDLKQHSELSKVDLSYYDEDSPTGEKGRFIPHCVEPSFGLDRTILAVLTDAYAEDEMNGETRIYLKFSPNIAPVKIAVFPLLKNKPVLVEKAKEIFKTLKKEFNAVEFDDNGNIGKRYRRQDEIGTPYCVTIDFETIEKNSGVTVRNRDDGKQERISENELVNYLKGKILK